MRKLLHSLLKVRKTIKQLQREYKKKNYFSFFNFFSNPEKIKK